MTLPPLGAHCASAGASSPASTDSFYTQHAAAKWSSSVPGSSSRTFRGIYQQCPSPPQASWQASHGPHNPCPFSPLHLHDPTALNLTHTHRTQSLIPPAPSTAISSHCRVLRITAVVALALGGNRVEQEVSRVYSLLNFSTMGST